MDWINFRDGRGIFGCINGKYGAYGWVCLLLENMIMIGFSVASGLYGILCQRVVFMATSVLGLWRSNGAKKA